MTLRTFTPCMAKRSAFFEIASMEMTEGDLPPNAQRLVKDWLPKHQEELAEMWRTQKIVELPPLD